MSIAEMAQKTC